MQKFDIDKPHQHIRAALQDKIDNLTKPKGSLGMLEDLALQIGWIQQTLEPTLSHPCHIIFAGDHGITAQGVSVSPQEVTYQMITNFWEGGAGINFLARQHNFEIKIVDAGVNYDFDPQAPIIHKKIRKSTRNYLHQSAMTTNEMEQAIEIGAQCVQQCFDQGSNIISIGEMGISNTSASALWMTYLTGIPLDKCIGAGSDHTGNIIAHKHNVLKQCIHNYQGDASAQDIMKHFGGYEMVMAVGAMLKAAQLKMIILIDGFIMTNCLLMASRLNKEVLHYCIYGHLGDEAGHKLLIDYLQAKPILNIGLRLGEGSGAICAYPIVESAVRMINQMSSFNKIQVTKYF